jgi:hypothetical protein
MEVSMHRRTGVFLVLLGAAMLASAQAPLVQPFGAAGSAPAAPWHVTGLPGQSKPFTQFSVVDLDGKRALKVEANQSYGNLEHPLKLGAPSVRLAWQWRIERLNEKADLHEKSGDDTALKVCVLFDQPMDRIPFADRQLLRFARSKTSDAVPGATVCYVWDAQSEPGTAIDSPFTRRLRYMVLRSGAKQLNQWVAERRDVAADFMKLFGDESEQVPPIVGVAVGADADNTKSRSIGYVSGVALEP